MHRRTFLTLMMVFGMCGLARADNFTVEVMKRQACGCCEAWVGHLRQSGFQVEAQSLDPRAMQRFKINHGIAPKNASCHTGRVGGYTIEGHVPARDIARLLKERPDAIGLAVPGMPVGSPGMEMGNRKDAYDVLLIGKNGETTVYTSYPAKAAK